jgi:hypothetical protein
LPDKLALQVPKLDKNPRVGAVYSGGYFFRDDPQIATGYVQAGLPTPSGDVFGELLRGNFLSPAVIVVRRSLLESVGGFDESQALMAVEDYDMWLRLAMQTEFLFVPGDVAAIRRHPQNISRDALRLRSRCLYMLQQLDKAYPDAMAAHPDARHEGYARQHGAIALAAWQQRKPWLATKNAFQAARHVVQVPGALNAVAAWWQRRRLRSGVTASDS